MRAVIANAIAYVIQRAFRTSSIFSSIVCYRQRTPVLKMARTSAMPSQIGVRILYSVKKIGVENGGRRSPVEMNEPSDIKKIVKAIVVYTVSHKRLVLKKKNDAGPRGSKPTRRKRAIVSAIDCAKLQRSCAAKYRAATNESNAAGSM